MEELAERIRLLLADDPNVSERRMFGGVCFMLNGNMLCGPTKDGDLMVRVGKELEAEAMAKPGTRAMDFTGRPMKGFVFVSDDVLQSDAALFEWIAFATRFVGALPAK